MRSYRNPFRLRTSEVQHRQGAALFLNTYGPAVLDLLPGAIWDRLFVIRSAPGGGKTSLMKLFEAETLRTLHERRDKFSDLADRLTEIGALRHEGPALVGARIDLRRNYRALLDLAGPPQLAERLFLRLMNARIAIGVLEAALTLAGRAFPGDVNLIRVDASGQATDALQRLGGTSGEALFNCAREAESEILDLIDSLMPVSAEALTGHADLHALRALQDAQLTVAGRTLDGPLLVMFDDGQDLSIGQWQKIALARAFLHQSQVVVLDEPTSALDANAEFELFQNFRERIGHRAAVVISHRLSTVRMADHIYVLDRGRIVEHGHHDALMDQNGVYQRLFERQAFYYR